MIAEKIGGEEILGVSSRRKKLSRSFSFYEQSFFSFETSEYCFAWYQLCLGRSANAICHGWCWHQRYFVVSCNFIISRADACAECQRERRVLCRFHNFRIYYVSHRSRLLCNVLIDFISLSHVRSLQIPFRCSSACTPDGAATIHPHLCLSRRELRAFFKRAYDRWNVDQHNQLTILHNCGHNVCEIATLMQRQPSAIKYRLQHLGLIAWTHWTNVDGVMSVCVIIRLYSACWLKNRSTCNSSIRVPQPGHAHASPFLGTLIGWFVCIVRVLLLIWLCSFACVIWFLLREQESFFLGTQILLCHPSPWGGCNLNRVERRFSA